MMKRIGLIATLCCFLVGCTPLEMGLAGAALFGGYRATAGLSGTPPIGTPPPSDTLNPWWYAGAGLAIVFAHLKHKEDKANG